jgi:hypothetical protein
MRCKAQRERRRGRSARPITNLGIVWSLGRAELDSRAAARSELFAKYNPPADAGDGLGAAFAQ